MSALRLSRRRKRHRLRSGQALARRAAGIAAMLVWSVSAAAQSPVAPSAPPDQFFDSNGVRIRYVEQGQGPAIVLMHGYTGTLDRHFIANGVFANLARDYRVIAMDLRGHGKSDKPHDPNAYGETMAGDVVRLLDHSQIPRAHVLGYSLGAMIAGRLATMHPTRRRSRVKEESPADPHVGRAGRSARRSRRRDAASRIHGGAAGVPRQRALGHRAPRTPHSQP